MKDWKYINDFGSLPDVDFMHCDTRDFHILCVKDKEHAEEVVKKIRKTTGYGTLSDCKFTKEEILTVLKDLETRSGGKGHWRHITTEEHGWLKYIRFVKCDDKYIAYTTSCDDYIVLSHDDLAAPINKDRLSHMG